VGVDVDRVKAVNEEKEISQTCVETHQSPTPPKSGKKRKGDGMKKIQMILVLIYVVGSILLFGCATVNTSGQNADTITADNYKKIEVGMTLSQVQQILGSGGTKGTTMVWPNGAVAHVAPADGFIYTWEEGGRTICEVFFTEKGIPRVRMGYYKER